jgi:hypothetical protein
MSKNRNNIGIFFDLCKFFLKKVKKGVDMALVLRYTLTCIQHVATGAGGVPHDRNTAKLVHRTS